MEANTLWQLRQEYKLNPEVLCFVCEPGTSELLTYRNYFIHETEPTAAWSPSVGERPIFVDNYFFLWYQSPYLYGKRGVEMLVIGITIFSGFLAFIESNPAVWKYLAILISESVRAGRNLRRMIRARTNDHFRINKLLDRNSGKWDAGKYPSGHR